MCRATATDANLVGQLWFGITGFPPGSILFNINSGSGFIRLNRSLYYQTENRLVNFSRAVFIKVDLLLKKLFAITVKVFGSGGIRAHASEETGA